MFTFLLVILDAIAVVVVVVVVVVVAVIVIRDLKQISRGQRRQNKKTNYTRQKVHVIMWNKADIGAVLLSCETSIAPFPSRLQSVVNIPRINVDIFVQEETLKDVRGSFLRM